MPKNIYVTESYLPPLESFVPYLEKIWESKVLTNGGVYHQELERRLSEHLDVPYVSLFNNATVALMIALKSLDLKGEIITTPYTFVATASSILWNDLKPVFVDVDIDNANMDIAQIRKAITSETTAIMPVHCYGNICNVEEIHKIAKDYNLKVVYDAAHAFGVKNYSGHGIMNYGDLSVISFHATKVFNTFEGGAIICHTPEMKAKIDSLKNFGIQGETKINMLGLNGKLNEVSSALGLLQLKHMSEILSERKRVYDLYIEHLFGVKGIKCLLDSRNPYQNYAYFPILVTDDYFLSRSELIAKLNAENIFPRKYFYPLVNEFEFYSQYKQIGSLANAKYLAEHVLCLPMYPNLKNEDVLNIVSIIKW